jgi:hypothetical protein
MNRFDQILLIAATLGASWLGMMAVHEFGHVITAGATGGSVRSIELPILGFSRTDLATNPRPLLVAWGGAVWGSVLPLMLLVVVRFNAPRYEFLARFFAGSCLIINGAYLSGGVWIDAGDASDLLRLGASGWQLLAFGLPAITVGLMLWHGMGPHFGLRQAEGRVDRRATIVAVIAFCGVLVMDLLFGLWQVAS